MSLDVLLEAADVLEKQKVASILTSMHEYDKNFANHSDNLFSKHLEKKPHYRSPQHEMNTTNILISENHRPLSPASKRVQYCSAPPRRRLTATKLTTRDVTMTTRDITMTTRDVPMTTRDVPMTTNYTLTSSSPSVGEVESEVKVQPPAKELYTFKVDSVSDTSRSNRGVKPGGETWHTRSIHNQMEKNRRAQLRVYMNNLRDVIPSGPNRRKLTTLTLLQNARAYIESLKEHEEEYEHDKQKLWRRHLRLREFLCQLSGSSVLTLPGIPITPGIRKFSVSQEADPQQPENVCPTCEEDGTGDNVSMLSDGSDSIGTFSDGGDAVSPDKEL